MIAPCFLFSLVGSIRFPRQKCDDHQNPHLSNGCLPGLPVENNHRPTNHSIEEKESTFHHKYDFGTIFPCCLCYYVLNIFFVQYLSLLQYQKPISFFLCSFFVSCGAVIRGESLPILATLSDYLWDMLFSTINVCFCTLFLAMMLSLGSICIASIKASFASCRIVFDLKFLIKVVLMILILVL